MTETTNQKQGPNPDRLLGKTIRELTTLPDNLLRALMNEGALTTAARLKQQIKAVDTVKAQVQIITDYHEALRTLPTESANRIAKFLQAITPDVPQEE